jgi:hypothetical protein
MLRCVRRFYLGDAIAKRLIVRARGGELSIDLEGELAISLLQVELRHRLVDERLRARAAESTLFD